MMLRWLSYRFDRSEQLQRSVHFAHLFASVQRVVEDRVIFRKFSAACQEPAGLHGVDNSIRVAPAFPSTMGVQGHVHDAQRVLRQVEQPLVVSLCHSAESLEALRFWQLEGVDEQLLRKGYLPAHKGLCSHLQSLLATQRGFLRCTRALIALACVRAHIAAWIHQTGGNHEFEERLVHCKR